MLYCGTLLEIGRSSIVDEVRSDLCMGLLLMFLMHQNENARKRVAPTSEPMTMVATWAASRRLLDDDGQSPRQLTATLLTLDTLMLIVSTAVKSSVAAVALELSGAMAAETLSAVVASNVSMATVMRTLPAVTCTVTALLGTPASWAKASSISPTTKSV